MCLIRTVISIYKDKGSPSPKVTPFPFLELLTFLHYSQTLKAVSGFSGTMANCQAFPRKGGALYFSFICSPYISASARYLQPQAFFYCSSFKGEPEMTSPLGYGGKGVRLKAQASTLQEEGWIKLEKSLLHDF